MKHNIPRLIISIIFLLFLSSCSADKTAVSDIPGTGDVSVLTFVAPNLVMSMPNDTTNDSYILVYNSGKAPVTGVRYKLSNQIGSGASIIIDKHNAEACAYIAADSFCNLRIRIPPQLGAGSFSLQASNIISNTLSENNPIVGVQAIMFNNISGPDGVNLLYYPVLLAGVKYLIVTGVVTSNSANRFNLAALVDSRGKLLPNQVSIGNKLGAGLPSLTQGDTFEILLPAPSGTDLNQTFLLKTSFAEADKTIVSSETSSLIYNLNTVSNQGILNTLPPMINLTSNDPTQIITLYNSGSKTITINSLNMNSSNVAVSQSGLSIAPGKTVTITAKMINESTVGTSSSLTVQASNGNSGNISDIVIINQNGNHLAPRPLPGPGKPGLMINFSNNNFSTNTYIGKVSQIVTLINTGKYTESNFVFTLPPGFSISPLPVLFGACTVNIQTNTVTNALTLPDGNSSCSLLMTYTNSQAISKTIENISVSYTYDSLSSASASQSVTVYVANATANLFISPLSKYFGQIANNESSTLKNIFEVSNSGDNSASQLLSTIGLLDGTIQLFNLYNSGSTNCQGSLNPGESCALGVQFGPTSEYIESNGVSQLNLNYLPDSTSSSTQTSALLNGAVIINESVTLSMSLTANVGFYSGSGISTDPLIISSDSQQLGSVTFTVANTSNFPAYNFNINLNTLPSYWTYSSGSCSVTASGANTVALNPGESCTISFSLSPALAPIGLQTFNENLIVAQWLNPITNQVTKNVISNDSVYINVVSPASFTLTTPNTTKDVSLTTAITLTFNQSVANVSTNNVQLVSSANSQPVPMTFISSTGNSYTFKPNVPLLSKTDYYVGINGPNTSQPITAYGIPLTSQSLPFSTVRVVAPWTTVSTPSPVLLATVDNNSDLFYSSAEGLVYQLEYPSNTFVPVAHFKKTSVSDANPGITTLSAGYIAGQQPSPYTIFVGVGDGGPTSQNNAFWSDVVGSDSTQLVNLVHDATIVQSPDWPTTAYFYVPPNTSDNMNIYWGSAFGNYYMGSNNILSTSDFDGPYYTAVNMVVSPLPGTPQAPWINVLNQGYSVGSSQTGFYSCSLINRGTCCQASDDTPGCEALSPIDSSNGVGSITADPSGNIYIGWYDGSVIQYQPNGSNPPSYNKKVFASASFPEANSYYVNTQVVWDNYHHQLLVYNYPNNSIVAYESSGQLKPTILPAPPTVGVNPGGYNIDGQQINYSFRNNATLIPASNGTIYFLGSNGQLYYVYYP